MNTQGDQAGDSFEKRTAPRKLLRKRAKLRSKGLPLMEATTTDISMGGLGLMAPQPMQAGQLCLITFQVLDGKNKALVLLQGKVARCTLSGMEGYRTGIQIVKIHPDSVETIHKLVQ